MALLLLGLRGVQATAPGRVMLSHARTVLQQVELLRSEIGRVAQRQITQVRLLGNSAAVRD